MILIVINLRVKIYFKNICKLYYSLRALFGIDGQRNALHGSDSRLSAEREISLLFPEGRALCMLMDSSLRVGLFVC